ncbi:MAG: rhodanese-like domain-containing protein [Calditrichaeota bacterium]|nr:rhodanese-like domain-containing protein [Calditrichota bacterium]
MSKKFSVILLIGIFAIFALGCSGDEQAQTQQQAGVEQAAIQHLNVDQVYELMQKDTNYVLIDVRTPAEYIGELGHIPGAELRPLQEIENWVQEIESLKNSDKKIVLVCRSGNRSRVAAEFLQEKGFKNLINMMGGMRAWNQKGYPVEK